MLVELAFLLLVAVIGRLLMGAAGMPDVDPSGVVVGTAVYGATVALLLVVGTPPLPLVAMGISLAVALLLASGGGSWSARLALSSVRPDRRTITSVLLVIVTGAVFHPLRLVRDATDAGPHLRYAALLHDGSLMIGDVGFKRGATFAAIEAIGVLAGDVAVMGVLPAFGMAALLSVYGIVRSLAPAAPSGKILGLIAVAVIATNARFITNLVLIGPHLVVAFWLLLLMAVLTASAARRGRFGEPARWLTIAALTIAIAAARGEGAILVVLAAAPFLVPDRDRAARLGDVRAVAVGMLLWLVPYHTDRFAMLPDSNGAATIAVAVLFAALCIRAVARLLARIPAVGIALFGAWGLLLAMAVVEPAGVIRRLISTAANVALDVGGWGVGLLLMIVIAGAVRVVTRSPLPLRAGLLLGAFVPVHILIAIFGAEGLNIGEGSSLNRMLFHAYPVLVVATVMAVLRMHREEERDEVAARSREQRSRRPSPAGRAFGEEDF